MIASARLSATGDRIVMVFKHEAEIEGEPIGPAVVTRESECGERGRGLGVVPFGPRCVCAPQLGTPGGRCPRCGDPVDEPWVTLTRAREKAAALGIELRKA